MTRCAACRRPLKDPDSINRGMGPGCARKAARASQEPDLFSQARSVAVDTLKAAVEECRALGVGVELSIKEIA